MKKESKSKERSILKKAREEEKAIDEAFAKQQQQMEFGEPDIF